METLDSGQQKTRERIESLITFVSPVFDVVLSVGERVSRVAEPIDHEYYPIHIEDVDEELDEDQKSSQ